MHRLVAAAFSLAIGSGNADAIDVGVGGVQAGGNDAGVTIGADEGGVSVSLGVMPGHEVSGGAGVSAGTSTGTVSGTVDGGADRAAWALQRVTKVSRRVRAWAVRMKGREGRSRRPVDRVSRRPILFRRNPVASLHRSQL
jgi:hypothetical protein